MNALNALTVCCYSLAKIGDDFPQSGKRLNWSDLWPYGIAAVVAALVTAIVVQIRKRNDMSQRCDDPQRLFRELCLAHRLDRGSVRVLRQLAEALGFEYPAQVFLTPAAFEPQHLPPAIRSNAAEYQALRQRLF